MQQKLSKWAFLKWRTSIRGTEINPPSREIGIFKYQ